jgi:hypothetical protein
VVRDSSRPDASGPSTVAQAVTVDDHGVVAARLERK